MASDLDFENFVVDQIDEEVSFRKMFGEYAVYCGGKVVALICDNRWKRDSNIFSSRKGIFSLTLEEPQLRLVLRARQTFIGVVEKSLACVSGGYYALPRPLDAEMPHG